MARKGWFGRLNDHFHEHPQGRLHEMMFWMGLGLALGVGAFVGWRAGKVTTPFALMFGVVAAVLVGWSFLPQRKPRTTAPPAPGRLRAERAEQVRSAKQEAKRIRDAKRGLR